MSQRPSLNLQAPPVVNLQAPPSLNLTPPPSLNLMPPQPVSLQAPPVVQQPAQLMASQPAQQQVPPSVCQLMQIIPPQSVSLVKRDSKKSPTQIELWGQIQALYPGANQIKVCFELYRKAQYSYAIVPIGLQVIMSNGEIKKLTYADYPIDELFIHLDKIKAGYLHIITIVGRHHSINDFTSDEYQQVAQELKKKWRPDQALDNDGIDPKSFL